MIKKIIKQFDFFGTFVTFRIKDEIEYKSIIGGLTSIIFVIMSISYTLYVGIPFIKRENINFIFSNKIVEKQPFINLTEVGFNMGFGIQYQDDSTPAIDDFIEYLNYSLILKEWIGENTIREFPFGLKSCTHTDFFNILNDTFDLNKIDKMLCPILNDSTNYTLDGLYTDYYYKFFEIEIKLTDKGMDNLNSVKSKMQSTPIEMVIYFIDTAMDYQNRTSPLPPYINYVKKGLNLNFIKTTEISISTIKFTNDENLFFENSNSFIDATFDKNEDSFHLVISREEQNENLVGKLVIKASAKVIVLNRSYQKLPSFIADLTGILEEILLVILLLINIMERQAIDNKLVHRMLKIKGSKYYEVDYYLNVFNRDKINNEVMNLIKRGTFQIERSNTGGIYSKRKSIMMILNSNEKFGNKNVRRQRSFFKNPHIKQNNHQIINYLENNLQSIQDNNINIQPSERDIIQILNSTNNVNKRFRKESINNLSINSIPSEDLESLENKKKTTINQSLNNSSNYQSETINNNSNYQTKRQLTATNFNLNNENIETQNNDISLIKVVNKNDEIKRAEESFSSIGVISSVFTSLCYWTSKYQRRRYELLIEAERKVHYYLEVFNYIKGMQEIDLLKYCLFDNEQITLFNFLTSPPLKTSSKKMNAIYKEFESEQVNVGKIKKKEIDKVYNSYNIIRNKNDVTFEDLKLLRLINAEVELLS